MREERTTAGKTCQDHIEMVIAFSDELATLAEEGHFLRQGEHYGALPGVVRDCARRIRAEAERERRAHEVRG